MNCFKCGSKCLTTYCVDTTNNNNWIISPNALDKITAVRKDCMNCEWHSYPTKVPEKISL